MIYGVSDYGTMVDVYTSSGQQGCFDLALAKAPWSFGNGFHFGKHRFPGVK